MKNPRPTILHIDDDPNDLLLLDQAARAVEVRFDLQSVSDGEKAIAYLSGTGVYADGEKYPAPLLVLLDLKMPRRTGFEILTWIRSHPRWKCLPVVILTSSQHNEDVKRAYLHGANSYLTKPVGFEGLMETAAALSAYWAGFNQGPKI